MDRRDARAGTESAREGFHMTTNLEGGHGEQEKVSSHLVWLIVSLRDNANSFLVPFNSLARRNAMMPLGEPGLPREECLAEGLVLRGSLVGE